MDCILAVSECARRQGADGVGRAPRHSPEQWQAQAQPEHNSNRSNSSLEPDLDRDLDLELDLDLANKPPLTATIMRTENIQREKGSRRESGMMQEMLMQWEKAESGLESRACAKLVQGQSAKLTSRLE